MLPAPTVTPTQIRETLHPPKAASSHNQTHPSSPVAKQRNPPLHHPPPPATMQNTGPAAPPTPAHILQGRYSPPRWDWQPDTLHKPALARAPPQHRHPNRFPHHNLSHGSSSLHQPNLPSLVTAQRERISKTPHQDSAHPQPRPTTLPHNLAPQPCHPERRDSQSHRESRSRRTCICLFLSVAQQPTTRQTPPGDVPKCRSPQQTHRHGVLNIKSRASKTAS
jgi:hypothetical protein